MTLSSCTKVVVLAAVLGTTTLPSHNAEAFYVSDIVLGLKKAYDSYKKFRAGETPLQQATDELLDAIDSAKDEILAQIDGIAAAEGRACARGVIINAEDMDAVSQDVREQLAFDGVYCLSLVESLIDTVDDEAAVDKLGFALNALAPVVQMARAQAGLSENSGVTDMIINGELAVIAKLYPYCSVSNLYGDSSGGFVETHIRCTAYNGDRGFGFSWVGDPNFTTKKEKAADTATRNTSRAVAQQMLPVITEPVEPAPAPSPIPSLPAKTLPSLSVWVY